MLKYSRNQKISLNLTLVNNDGKSEENANVSYVLYDDEYNEILSSENIVYNPELNSYIDIINPWDNQKEGIYYIVWSIKNTIEEFPEKITEEMYIDNFDENLKRILGLVHQNLLIDQTQYDQYGNMVSARLIIYSDSNSVGTNNNIIAKYRISASSQRQGTFLEWRQVEI